MPHFNRINSYAFVCIYSYCNITNWTFASKLESHWWERDVVSNLLMKNNKKLLDEVFLIFRIIKVEARVMSRSQRLRLMTLTETLIILDITETEANDGFFFPWTKIYVFAFAWQATQSARTWYDYPYKSWSSTVVTHDMTARYLDMIIVSIICS